MYTDAVRRRRGDEPRGSDRWEVTGAYAGFSAAHEALDVLSEIVTPG